jgi:solute carrier family 1 (high affinity glutamate transporter) protein 1
MDDVVPGTEPDNEPSQNSASEPASEAASGHKKSGSGHGHRLTIMIVVSIVLAILTSLALPPMMYTESERFDADRIEKQIWDLEKQRDAAAKAAEQDPSARRKQLKDLDDEIAKLRKTQPSHESALAFFEAIGIGGEIFLRMLSMMVVPLVIASVMNGILGMGDVRKLGRPGLTAIVYYISTTILAVIVGLIIVSVLKPGEVIERPEQAFARLDSGGDKSLDLAEYQADFEKYEQTISEREFQRRDTDGDELLLLAEFRGNNDSVDTTDRQKVVSNLAEESGLEPAKIKTIFPQLSDQEAAEDSGPSMGTIFSNLLLMLFTDNLLGAATETQLLPLIVFSIIFAGMLTTLGSKVDVITDIIEQTNTALMSFVMILMKVAPIGIFCLVASRFGAAQAKGEFIATLSQTGWFVLTVLLGLGMHLFGTLPLLFWIFKRENPFRFMRQMSQALLTAFSTASSSATLPVTMESAIDRGGVSKRSVEFVLPLGATINMDGTALYEAAAAIFIAQVYALSPEGQAVGFELTLGSMLVIAVTATLAAIGAAGIPEAGLVTMMIVLNAVGLPLHYVSLILSVDWLLDRFRTATNTFGDAVGAAIVDETFSD